MYEAPELAGHGYTRLLGGRPSRLPVFVATASLGLDVQRDGAVAPRLFSQAIRIETPPLAAGAVRYVIQVGAAPRTSLCIHRATAYVRDGSAPHDPTTIRTLRSYSGELFYSSSFPSPDGPEQEHTVEEVSGVDGGGALALVTAPNLDATEEYHVLADQAAATTYLRATGPLYLFETPQPDTGRHNGRIGVVFQRTALNLDVDHAVLVLTYSAAPAGVYPYHA